MSPSTDALGTIQDRARRIHVDGCRNHEHEWHCKNDSNERHDNVENSFGEQAPHSHVAEADWQRWELPHVLHWGGNADAFIEVGDHSYINAQFRGLLNQGSDRGTGANARNEKLIDEMPANESGELVDASQYLGDRKQTLLRMRGMPRFVALLGGQHKALEGVTKPTNAAQMVANCQTRRAHAYDKNIARSNVSIIVAIHTNAPCSTTDA